MVAGHQATVLVVEDNPATRHVLERILAIKGYPAISVDNAPEALRYLRSGGRASVIVLDLHLPTMDGRAFLAELRSDPRLARIPVVVFSGDPGQVSDVAAFVRKGRDDPEVLLDAIAACVNE
jgi:CheY-like chemotaxis protein